MWVPAFQGRIPLSPGESRPAPKNYSSLTRQQPKIYAIYACIPNSVNENQIDLPGNLSRTELKREARVWIGDTDFSGEAMRRQMAE